MADGRNALETLGRALQGFGYGVQGRTPPFVEEDIARERMGQQESQFARELSFREQQLKESTRMHEATIAQIRATMGNQAVDTILKARTSLSGLPPEQQESFANFLTETLYPGFQQIHSFSSKGTPVEGALPDKVKFKEFLSVPGALEGYLKRFGRALDPATLQAARQINAEKGTNEAVKYLDAEEKRMKLDIAQAARPFLSKIIGAVQTKKPGQAIEVSHLEESLHALVDQLPDQDLTTLLGRPVHKDVIKESLSEFLADPKGQAFLKERGVLVGDITPSQQGLTETLSGAIQEDPEFAKAGVPITRFSTLAPDVRQRLITGAQKRIQAREVEQRERTGSAAAAVALDQPVAPKDRSEHVNVKTLLESGELVQPPVERAPGVPFTYKDLRTGPYVHIENKQKDQLGELAVSNQTLGSLYALADRLITAKTGPEAWAQGLRLHKEAFTGENPLAKSYQDAKTGFLGPISRSIAKERGVLTDRDIGRIDSAMSSFFDTRASKDLKKAIVTDIYEVSRRSSIAAIAGQPLGPFKSQVSDLLKRLDRVNADALKAAIPKDQRVIRHPQTGELRAGPRTQAIPKGWEAFD